MLLSHFPRHVILQYITYLNAQGQIRPVSIRSIHCLMQSSYVTRVQLLMGAGGEFRKQVGRGQYPGLLVAILPENASDVYTAVKQYVAIRFHATVPII